MTTPPPGGSGPTLKATDLRYRNAGQILLNRFSALVRIGRAYQVGNQVFGLLVDGGWLNSAAAAVSVPRFIIPR